MSDKLQELIKSIIQQCKIDSMSTKDLVKELSILFESVQRLENEVDKLNNKIKTDSSEYYKIKESLEEEIKSYKKNYVIPALELKRQKEELEKETFKFNVEKEYKNREVQIYKELLRVRSAAITQEESYHNYSSGGSGSNYSRNQSINSGSFPDAICKIKFGDEKNDK